MPYDDDIDVEVEEGLTEKDRLCGLPSGFGQYHSRFHPTSSNSFRETAEREDIDIAPETTDPAVCSEVDAFLDSVLYPTR